jgi:hypothetical protein
VLFALIAVVYVFGWTGGKLLVGSAYHDAKEKTAEAAASRKEKRAAKKEAKS